MRISRLLLGAVCLLATISASPLLTAQDLPAIPPIKRVLPPPGIEVPAEVRKELEAKLAALAPRIAKLNEDQYGPDIEVFTKAVQFALRFNEFYDKKDFDKARWALQQAEERVAFAEKNEFPWLRQTGLVVRGYRSTIDGSVQPYGLVIPIDHDFTEDCPLYVFLHGRGDKETDLHFLYGRARSKGEIVPDNAIVAHPFGRQCIGFKSAGEMDVLELFQELHVQYDLTQETVLIGFSMGGAGAWHLGAHYPNVWSVVSPGAGFVDVARYQKLKPANYPPIYEQKLWGNYDVPAYTRNLFNVPVIAYSGELDKQKDAADFMAESFRQEGRELTHLIGPGTEHKYHPDTKRELLSRIKSTLQEQQTSRANFNKTEAHLQTRTLSYNTAKWLTALELMEHWQDSRLDGKYVNDRWEVATKGVRQFRVEFLRVSEDMLRFVIDGQAIETPNQRHVPTIIDFRRQDDRWKIAEPTEESTVHKRHGLQGPIDDAFLDEFLVVLPSGKSPHPRVQQWIDFEVAHLRERWAATFRGELPVKFDTQVTKDDIYGQHLVCFGDANSNVIIQRALPKLPLSWSEKSVTFNGKDYDAAKHLPLMIYPNPLQATNVPHRKYIVLNSGPTFREAHDRTNSLQNPKLPDWAIIDITTPPDATAPGKVVAADFFDEQWQIKPTKK